MWIQDIDTVSRMQNMCSFHTFSTGRISPFCGIFTEDEWKSYSYGQDLQAYNNAGSFPLCRPPSLTAQFLLTLLDPFLYGAQATAVRSAGRGP